MYTFVALVSLYLNRKHLKVFQLLMLWFFWVTVEDFAIDQLLNSN